MPEFLVSWQNCPCAIQPLLPQSCLLVVVEASETRSAMTTVVIHVTDVNDNPPTFMKEEFRYVYTAYRKASGGDSVLRAECLFFRSIPDYFTEKKSSLFLKMRSAKTYSWFDASETDVWWNRCLHLKCIEPQNRAIQWSCYEKS